MASQSQVELTSFDDHEASRQDYQTLPPADTGRAAYSFLAACFVMEALVWGFPFAFGVFQVYYTAQDQFAAQSNVIAAIGTTATGVMYFMGPVLAVLGQRWPRSRQPTMYVGLAIMIASLVIASFCTTVSGLLVTQGVMYAVGGVSLYFPVMQLVDEWFITSKSKVRESGTGSAGIAIPFIMQALLDRYGYQTALRVWAVAALCLALPCMPFLRPRLPVSAAGAFRPADWAFLKRPAFWLYELGNVGQSLGYFLPGLYIPAYADSLGLPTYAGPLALGLYNIGFCAGTVGLGMIIDRYHVTNGILISTIGSLIAVFGFWGFTTTQPMLYMFAILYGMFGGSFSVTWSGCVGALRQTDTNIDAGLVIGLMAAGKGIGAVISGPLSAALLAADTWRGHAGFAYGSGYGPLVVFSGVSAALGGTAWIGRQFRLI
ncbi:hypothetical protein AMS68_006492 [Peltaster fructicola]|uniref:Major facilitator superfamily (MFS) profile domain-containing protein n=1 Tax=Peltaster fructicola TaxID=286661 RepID=A0A6H0Y236_9PEZI|nr:hypothetical protein AMS68_006492 [Peltaster fructicola]